MPAFALFEPVFWLLVPGSLGLVALTEAFGRGGSSSDPTDANDVLYLAGASIVAITIGMILASALGRLIPPVQASAAVD